MITKQYRKAQTEVIVTVLLILIGIIAVSLVSAWVLNLVRNNLKNTGCLDTAGQITIDLDHTYLWSNDSNQWLYLSLERGTKDFNLSGFVVIYGNEFTTGSKIKVDKNKVDKVHMVNSTGGIDSSSDLIFPSSGEQRTYAIDVTTFGMNNIDNVKVSPIIQNSIECDKTDEQKVSIRV